MGGQGNDALCAGPDGAVEIHPGPSSATAAAYAPLDGVEDRTALLNVDLSHEGRTGVFLNNILLSELNALQETTLFFRVH